jgi:chemosensory pili system protein ChpA (sensor histidine kinase/response regulator)
MMNFQLIELHSAFADIWTHIDDQDQQVVLCRQLGAAMQFTGLAGLQYLGHELCLASASADHKAFTGSEWIFLRDRIDDALSSAYAGHSFPAAALLAINSLRANDGRPLFSASHWPADVLRVEELLSDETERAKLKPWLIKAAQLFKLAVVQIIKGEADGLRALQKLAPRLSQVSRRFASHGLWLQVEKFAEHLTAEQLSLQLPQLLLRHVLQVLVNIAKQDHPEAPMTHADNLAKQLAVYQQSVGQKATPWRQLKRDERLGGSIQAMHALQSALIDFFEAGSEFDVLMSVPGLAKKFADTVADTEADDLAQYGIGISQYVAQQVLGRKVLPSAERIEQMTRIIVTLEVALQRQAWGLDYSALLTSIERPFQRLTEDLVDDVDLSESIEEVVSPQVVEQTPVADEEEVDPELVEIFVEEVREVLADMASHCQYTELNQAALTEIRRGYHTIKGSGRMVKATHLGEFGWALENFFNQYLQGTAALTISPKVLVEEANQAIEVLLNAFEAGDRIPLPTKTSNMIALLQEQTAGSTVVAEKWLECFADDNTSMEPIAAPIDPVASAGNVPETMNILLACGDVLDEIYPATLARDIDFPWHVEAHKLDQQSHTLAQNHPTLASLLRAMADFLLRHEVTESVLERFEIALQQAFDALNLIAAEQPVTIADKYINDLVVQMDPEQQQAIEQQSQPVSSEMVSNDAQQDEEPSEKKLLASSDEEVVNPELVAIFSDEASELCEAIENSLNQWQQNVADTAVLPELLRLLHTLKGGARMVNWRDVASASHDFESELLLLDKKVTPTPEQFKTWFAQYRTVLALLHARNSLADEDPMPMADMAKQQAIVDVLKLPVEDLDDMANVSCELSISSSQMMEQRLSLVKATDDLELAQQRLVDQLRRLDMQTKAQITYRREQVSTGEEDFDPLEMDRYTQLQQLTNSLLESASDVADIKSTTQDILRHMENTLVQQGRLNKTLTDNLHAARMIPVTRLLPKLRRLVTQLGEELGKPVQFLTEHIEGELQRSVLERIGTSLEHIIRNALDHGIELPEQRSQLNKPAEGTIKLSVSRQDNELVFLMSDDGRGVDPEIVLAKAIERGIVSAEDTLSDDDILKLIMRPGFSTAEKITEISGRGVGLDVVDGELLSLGGRVEIQSKVGEGTQFSLAVPFSQSMNRALLVDVAGQSFAIPFSGVEGIMRLPQKELLAMATQKDPAVGYGNQRYTFCRLEDLLGLDETTTFDDINYYPIILVKTGDGNFAIRVDILRGSRALVVKSLGPQFGQLLGVAGATIMGDGRVLTILDLPPLLRSWHLGMGFKLGDDLELMVDKTPPCIMIVDDSITVRKITSKLLIRHDFEVMMAKDGVDAIEQLEHKLPEVILLDVEMPRMDGFEFATHIRHHNLWQDIPIIMISSRSGSKHRQRAEKIGVNYLLSKPYREEQLLDLLQQCLELKSGAAT